MNFTFFRSFEAHAVLVRMFGGNIEFSGRKKYEKFFTRVQVDNFHFYPLHVLLVTIQNPQKMIHRYASDVGVDDTKIYASIICKLLFHTLGMKKKTKKKTHHNDIVTTRLIDNLECKQE